MRIQQFTTPPISKPLSQDANKEYQQTAQVFAEKSTQALQAMKKEHTSPAQQSNTLFETRKILNQAKQVIGQNPNKPAQAQQAEVIESLNKETREIKAAIDKSAVAAHNTQDIEQAARPMKNELIQKMFKGLASDLPEVRQNARQSLAKLGVTEKEMDEIRFEVEAFKMRQSKSKGLSFSGHFPVKLNTPQGILFRGNDKHPFEKGCVNPCTDSHSGGIQLGADGNITFGSQIAERIANNHSMNDIANQAVQYDVNNVAHHLNPVIFAGSWVQDGTINGSPKFIWDNNH
jgi:hypothetical protein